MGFRTRVVLGCSLSSDVTKASSEVVMTSTLWHVQRVDFQTQHALARSCSLIKSLILTFKPQMIPLLEGHGSTRNTNGPVRRGLRSRKIWKNRLSSLIIMTQLEHHEMEKSGNCFRCWFILQCCWVIADYFLNSSLHISHILCTDFTLKPDWLWGEKILTTTLINGFN